MSQFRVEFPNEKGQKLSAYLDTPADERPRFYAVYAHCFTCSKNVLASKYISKTLARQGIAVLRFDFTGLGESEGDFSDTNFNTMLADIRSAANFLKENYAAPKLLVGHSLGGTAAIYAAPSIESVEMVSTVGSPSCPRHVVHMFSDKLEQIEMRGEATVSLSGREFKIKRHFIDALSVQNEYEAIHNLHKPILIFHSPIDNQVSIENAARIYSHALHPKNFISLDDANHLVTDKDDARYIGQMISSWSKRYIKKAAEPELRTQHSVAVRTGADSFTTAVVAGEHHLLADEPIDVGGSDLGPTPYELLLASLGSCTSITLQMYAKRKGWALEKAIVHLNHSRKHITDATECENPEAKADVFERTIEFVGDLDADQRQRLLAIAEKCPVHKTLHNTIRVNTRLK